jgi:hypothetical protein
MARGARLYASWTLFPVIVLGITTRCIVDGVRKGTCLSGGLGIYRNGFISEDLNLHSLSTRPRMANKPDLGVALKIESLEHSHMPQVQSSLRLDLNPF